MYLQQFITEEDGVETMEWIAILMVTAVLIGICAQIAKVIKTKTKGIANSL